MHAGLSAADWNGRTCLAKPPSSEWKQKTLAFASVFCWYARLESNQRPLESESNALSIWATGAYLVVGFCDSRQIVVNDHVFFLCRSRKRRCGKALRHISTGNAWNVGVCHSIQLSYGRIWNYNCSTSIQNSLLIITTSSPIVKKIF